MLAIINIAQADRQRMDGLLDRAFHFIKQAKIHIKSASYPKHIEICLSSTEAAVYFLLENRERAEEHHEKGMADGKIVGYTNACNLTMYASNCIPDAYGPKGSPIEAENLLKQSIDIHQRQIHTLETVLVSQEVRLHYPLWAKFRLLECVLRTTRSADNFINMISCPLDISQLRLAEDLMEQLRQVEGEMMYRYKIDFKIIRCDYLIRKGQNERDEDIRYEIFKLAGTSLREALATSKNEEMSIHRREKNAMSVYCRQAFLQHHQQRPLSPRCQECGPSLGRIV